MMFALLGIGVALVAFAAAVVAASAALAALWPAALSAAGRAPAVSRARLLYALRLMPAALGVLVAVALTSAAWARLSRARPPRRRAFRCWPRPASA